MAGACIYGSTDIDSSYAESSGNLGLARISAALPAGCWHTPSPYDFVEAIGAIGIIVACDRLLRRNGARESFLPFAKVW